MKEGETDKPQNFDARVVHTVRNLKKQPSRQSDDSSIGETTQNKINKLSPNDIRKSLNELKSLQGRISIDGSGHSTSDSTKEKELIDSSSNKNLTNNINKTLQSKKTLENKVFKISGTSKSGSMVKTKTEFQKRLMNEGNVNKYKSMCMTMLKDDEEMRKLCEDLNLISPGVNSTALSNKEVTNLDKFLDENFFCDKYFMYKLESLLESDVSKVKREKFFKDEIKSYLGLKILDMQYENKIKSLDLALDCHIRNIESFNFFN